MKKDKQRETLNNLLLEVLNDFYPPDFSNDDVVVQAVREVLCLKHSAGYENTCIGKFLQAGKKTNPSNELLQ